jgi:oligopeptide transport system substrate-binding protein
MLLKIRVLASVLLTALFIFPLTAQDNPPNKQEDVLQNDFVIGLASQEITLNPIHVHKSSEIQILTGLYEGLMTYHPITLEPTPAAAERWTLSDDKLTYTFYIRENAYFSNGDPVRAQDFRDTLLLLLNPAQKAEYSVYLDVIKGAENYRKGISKDPNSVGIYAPEDKVLVITLEQPTSHFLKLLCILSFAPIYHSYLSQTGWDKKAPLVSNGPFYLYRRTEHELVLKKNDHYWDKEHVSLDGVRILFYDDPKQVAKDFNDGKIQWTSLNDCDFEALDSRSKSKIQVYPMFATSFFFFVCKNKPWNDPKVRKGLALLIPWDKLRSKDYSPLPTDKLIPQIPKYPEVKGIAAQDIDQGLSLLKQAGYPKGKGLPPIRFLVSKGNTLFADIVSKAWKDNLEVKVEYKEVEPQDFFPAMGKHDYTISSYTWIGDFADPLAFLQMWTSKSNLNEALFSHKKYDSLIQESLASIGLDRYKKLSEAEEILLQDAVILPINHIASFNIIDLDAIDGWYSNILDIHPLKYIEFKSTSVPPWIVRKPALPGMLLAGLFGKAF